MSDTPTVASAEISSDRGTFTVESNSGATSAAIKESLSKKDEAKEPEKEAKPDPSKAAAELGKLGGKAAAEKRAAAAKAEAKETKKQEKREAKADADEKAAEPADGDEKADEEGPEADGKGLGNPRHSPAARAKWAAQKEAAAKRELAAERAEKELDRQEMQRLRAEFEALKRGETSGRQEKPKLFDPSKPRPEDFEDYEDYLDARESWTDLKRSAAAHQERRYSNNERVVADAVDRMAGKVKEAGVGDRLSPEVLELKPVFGLEAGESPTGANFLASAILSDPDAAPGLLVHFSEHPEDLERISALSSVHSVLREVGRIEAGLGTTTPQPERQEEREREVSKAPHPVKAVPGGPHVPDDVEYRPGVSFDNYAAARLKQIRAKS